jgi:hypothetical protein
VLLFKKGGWWTDLDVVCLKFYNFSRDVVLCSQKHRTRHFKVFPVVDNKYVTTNVMKCPVKWDLIRYCLQAIEKTDLTKIQWGKIGPDLLNHIKPLIMSRRTKYLIRSPGMTFGNSFCPVSPARIRIVFIYMPICGRGPAWTPMGTTPPTASMSDSDKPIDSRILNCELTSNSFLDIDLHFYYRKNYIQCIDKRHLSSIPVTPLIVIISVAYFSERQQMPHPMLSMIYRERRLLKRF